MYPYEQLFGSARRRTRILERKNWYDAFKPISIGTSGDGFREYETEKHTTWVIKKGPQIRNSWLIKYCNQMLGMK